MSTLFDPVLLGDIRLQNRILMAPMTRNRATMPGRTPNAAMARYYAQRASAGAILTEATSVSPTGVGYPNTPGIWSEEQTVGWRGVVDAVHAAGGRILLQLWHVGRLSDPSYHGGAAPVAPSAIAADGPVALLRPARPYPIPRALETDEIQLVIDEFEAGARNALAAGFDGVELHAANGYLLDQFLQDGSNTRTDRYGGSIENRARLLLEVTAAVAQVWGAGRVGVHLAPRGDAQWMGDSDPAATFGYVAAELGAKGIGFLCLRESLLGGHRYGPGIKRAFGGSFVLNEDFTAETAEATVASGEADAIAFGKAFLANPDLPRRIALGAPLNAWKPDSFYAAGEEGYLDYPAMEEAHPTSGEQRSRQG